MMTAAGGEPVYVEDVFDVNKYYGSGGSQTITNGIDLSTNDGLVWIKRRSTTSNHRLFCGENGSNISHSLLSDGDYQLQTDSTNMASFNTDGFTVNGSDTNASGGDYVSFTFRKCPNFFDAVSYTGNGVNGRTISHNLGAVPGCIIFKRTDSSGDWQMWHRGLNNGSNDQNYSIKLNGTQPETGTSFMNNTLPTATQFTVSNGSDVNALNATYVAYIFAHNGLYSNKGTFGTTGDQPIIKCGYYTGDGINQQNYNIQKIDLGFQPQWVLAIPSYNYYESRYIMNSATKMNAPTGQGEDDVFLKADEPAAEQGRNLIDVLPDGFNPKSTINISGVRYIYIAVSAPQKTLLESGDPHFDYYLGSDTTFDYSSIEPDFAIMYNRGGSYPTPFVSSRTWSRSLYFANDSDSLSYPGSSFYYGRADKTLFPGIWGSVNYRGLYFKEAPGFIHTLGYIGKATSGSTTTYTKDHGLKAVPEMIWLRSNDVYYSEFLCWHKNMGGTTDNYSNNLYMNFEVDTGRAASNYWGYQTGMTVTDSTFTVGSNYEAVNQNNKYYWAALFASQDGISKVGSYSGTGQTQNIDCGFASTASFVMIKRADGAGHWYIFDKNMGGIPAATGQAAAYRLDIGGSYLNSSSENLWSYSSGFQVPYNASEVNNSGEHYIFWAVA